MHVYDLYIFFCNDVNYTVMQRLEYIYHWGKFHEFMFLYGMQK